MIESIVRSQFPRVDEAGFRIASPVDPRYNCIAWAAGDASRWWWPTAVGDRQLGGTYWPTGPLMNRPTLEDFEAAFQALGYSSCEDGILESGFEKVAIYADAAGNPTHAARQTSAGYWVSKLGQSVDIEHNDVAGVSGERYGEVQLYMKRATP